MVSTNLPRLVVAAPASRQGKTTVATGLLAALSARGLDVSGHKVGPDYIDPGYHRLATGRAGRNLDPHLQGEERVVPLFLHGAATPTPADVAIIEGVMGLFDGAIGGHGFASTAHVARLIDAPVLLVVDVSAASRSVAATVHGFSTFDPSVRVAGVVLNKVGSPRHEAEVRTAIERAGVPVLGALYRDPNFATPSRHLGLIPAAERREDAGTSVEFFGAAIERHIDLDAVLALARSAAPLEGLPWDPVTEVSRDHARPREIDVRRPVIAVASGPAFTFRYTETDELLEAAGAQVVPFDPLLDDALPPGCDALYLGGGFPEVHAEGLSANLPLRESVTAAVAGGMPVVAECAGLLYLCRTLDGMPMTGVLPADAVMSPRLTLGYRTTADGASGHEFHRTVVEPSAGDVPAWQLDVRDDAGTVTGSRPEGFVAGSVRASYLHVHWAGHPALAAAFAEAARAHRESRASSQDRALQSAEVQG